MPQDPSHTRRLQWPYYARGLAILLVVYRHAFEGLKTTFLHRNDTQVVGQYLFLEHANIFFYSFRMPLFFIISGTFISASLTKRGLRAFTTSKYKTILYPYFLWGFIQITIQIFASGYINSTKTIHDYLYLFYSPREVEQFWYLLALFNITILYSILMVKARLSDMTQLILGIAMYLVGTYFGRQKMELYFISDILNYYVYFAAGHLVSTSILNGNLHRFFRSYYAILVLIIPFILVQAYYLKTNIANISIEPKYLYVFYYEPIRFLIIAAIGCAFIFSLSMLFERWNIFKWLVGIGKKSLEIYVMHVIAFAAARTFFIDVVGINNFPLLFVLCIAVGIALPLAICYLADKLNIPYLFSLEGLKKTSIQISRPQTRRVKRIYEKA